MVIFQGGGGMIFKQTATCGNRGIAQPIPPHLPKESGVHTDLMREKVIEAHPWFGGHFSAKIAQKLIHL